MDALFNVVTWGVVVDVAFQLVGGLIVGSFVLGIMNGSLEEN